MNLHSLISICDAYAKLGDAIQSQVRAVLEGEPVEDQNANALRYARRNFIDVARRHGVDVSEWDEATETENA